MKGFQKLLATGVEDDIKMEYLVMEKLDIDLENFFIKSSKKLKRETIMLIGIQLLERIEKLHNLGFTHNDIKP
eukprot:CAMPEP_0202966898 /NCGR_PEP_ID=MMETSP1396-20130829/11546_1 /ASSEMBLY_ACC=CAM_ASM_000872 /TAXON_ID= /ORGANISM="Pseudokeronopsis sp., Strain Brazil" /LENGTH=72 /DNA_ID=CAMNT_0049691327 /DNA_START=312 /DNA_END=530 /DNA_ORIENTATION=-